MPNNKPFTAIDLSIKPGDKVKTFFKHPDFDARIGVYYRQDIQSLVFSFMSQGTSPDGTRRNPERRAAFMALLPQLRKHFGMPSIVRYGSSKTPGYITIGLSDQDVLVQLYRKGITYRYDMVFRSTSKLDRDIAIEELDLVPCKNRPAKQATF
tara:strand:- start:152 stop:610 length:459 start_codon:yes stop_codon:yes gene_type:complete